jgi:hypothetical protein
MIERRSLCAVVCLVLAPGLLVGGCSSSSSPFSKSSDFDRTFIAAAQTWDLNKDGVVTCNEWNEYIP